MIAIPNMEKPKSCGGCEFNCNLEGGGYEWWECVILHDDINQFNTRRTDCPLIEIDDELFKKAESAYVLQQIRSK